MPRQILLLLMAFAPGTPIEGADPSPGMASWLDVMDLGARGDGSGDDAGAFQAAHDSLPAGGGLIFVPPGIFPVSRPIVLRKPVRLLGAGRGSVLQAAGSGLTAVIECRAGADGSTIEELQLQGSKTGPGGAVERGILIDGARRCLVQNVIVSGPRPATGFNIGVDINEAHSEGARVVFCRFERLVSSGGNGTAILLESARDCLVLANEIDGGEAGGAEGGAGAAIFLAASSAGTGCVENRILQNRIRAHPQAGIALNSTTYCEFPGALGACDRNVIEGNDISGSSNPRGGDASSGIVITGRSSHNRIAGNRVRGNGHPIAGGHGIVLCGSAGRGVEVAGASHRSPIVIATASPHGLSTGDRAGVSGVRGNTAANGSWTITVLDAHRFALDGSAGNGEFAGGGLAGPEGTAMLDEAPASNEVSGNSVSFNLDDGIRIQGAVHTRVLNNICHENGQRGTGRSRNVVLIAQGGAASGGSTVIMGNDLMGLRLLHQIEVGAGVPGTVIHHNHLQPGASAAVLDGGIATYPGSLPAPEPRRAAGSRTTRRPLPARR